MKIMENIYGISEEDNEYLQNAFGLPDDSAIHTVKITENYKRNTIKSFITDTPGLCGVDPYECYAFRVFTDAEEFIDIMDNVFRIFGEEIYYFGNKFKGSKYQIFSNNPIRVEGYTGIRGTDEFRNAIIEFNYYSKNKLKFTHKNEIDFIRQTICHSYGHKPDDVDVLSIKINGTDFAHTPNEMNKSVQYALEKSDATGDIVGEGLDIREKDKVKILSDVNRYIIECNHYVYYEEPLISIFRNSSNITIFTRFIIKDKNKEE